MHHRIPGVHRPGSCTPPSPFQPQSSVCVCVCVPPSNHSIVHRPYTFLLAVVLPTPALETKLSYIPAVGGFGGIVAARSQCHLGGGFLAEREGGWGSPAERERSARQQGCFIDRVRAIYHPGMASIYPHTTRNRAIKARGKHPMHRERADTLLPARDPSLSLSRAGVFLPEIIAGQSTYVPRYRGIPLYTDIRIYLHK